MVLMRGHNICFCAEYRKLFLHYSCNPFLSGVLIMSAWWGNASFVLQDCLLFFECSVSRRSRLKVYEYTLMIFYHFYKGKQLLWLPVCFPGQCSPFKIGSTLKGKNLLLEEQILFVKSWGSPSAQWVKHWPTDLAVPGWSPAPGEIFSSAVGVSLHTAFHYHPPIVLIWLKYCWKGHKISSSIYH